MMKAIMRNCEEVFRISAGFTGVITHVKPMFVLC